MCTQESTRPTKRVFELLHAWFGLWPHPPSCAARSPTSAALSPSPMRDTRCAAARRLASRPPQAWPRGLRERTVLRQARRQGCWDASPIRPSCKDKIPAADGGAAGLRRPLGRPRRRTPPWPPPGRPRCPAAPAGQRPPSRCRCSPGGPPSTFSVRCRNLPRDPLLISLGPASSHTDTVFNEVSEN